MTEINNIHNYGYKIDRIDIKKENATKPISELQKEPVESQYAVDTGVLGRSQIHGLKSGNIKKSIDETLDMAKNSPIKLGCSQNLFDSMYKHYVNAGLSESDAYMKALLDEEEFLNLAEGYKK